jgi:hypothetical protein
VGGVRSRHYRLIRITFIAKFPAMPAGPVLPDISSG